jgi:hypothetical protein
MHGVNARAFYTSARFAILIGAAVIVSRCGGPDAPAARYQPVATVDQVMDAIVIPSSQAIFDAVVYDNGVLVQAPKADDDWFGLQMHALAVAEAGNLLLMPPRAKDTGDWQTMSHAMTDAAVKVARAAEAKDIDGLLATGGEMYAACTGCHRKYLPMD